MKKSNFVQAIFLCLILCMFVDINNANAQFWKKKKKHTRTTEIKDSTGGQKTSDAYDKFIKEATVTKGMFNIYRKKDKIYLEIPKNIMQRDFLLSSRVSSSSATWQIDPGTINRPPLLITFSADDNKVYMHFTPTLFECDTTSEMYSAFVKGNRAPIWKAFKIEVQPKDSSSYIFEANSLFLASIDEFSPFPNLPDFMKQFISFGGSFQSDRSSIDEVKAFQNNIIVKSMMTYNTSDEGPLTTIEARNIILLPEKPLHPRLTDDRIGYFQETRARYSENQDNMQIYAVIHRWDIQPKEDEMDKYFAGERVEPAKPIIWYVDPAIPAKWRTYVKLGILDWNKAFEEIGFKNVIVVKDYPVDDPNFDPDDIRYNCYRFLTKWTQNSMGPSWVDPRSGEILSADVISWYGVVDLLNKWRLIQTGAVDPSVRKRNMTDENMGEAIRYVAAHEIGHTLGLMHNFGASSTFPVEKLRDPEFTQKYGTTPSIMDYARFNYVAQPGDPEKGVKLTPPLIGEYDKFAIEYGYKIVKASTPEEERNILGKIVDQKRKNAFHFYGAQIFAYPLDPRSQAEDLSDDIVKANTYGINNLKYVAQNFTDWIAEPGKNNMYMQEMYKEILNQFFRYLKHAYAVIGGIYDNYKYQGEAIELYGYVPKEKQKKAIQFILTNLEEVGTWMNNKKTTEAIGPQLEILNDRDRHFKLLLGSDIMNRLQIAELDGEKNLTLDEFIHQIYTFVFTKKTGKLSASNMAMQNNFIDELRSIVDKNDFKSGNSSRSLQEAPITTTCSSHAFCEAQQLLNGKKLHVDLSYTGQLDKAMKRPVMLKYLKKCYQTAKSRMQTGDEQTRNHYQLIIMKLNTYFN